MAEILPTIALIMVCGSSSNYRKYDLPATLMMVVQVHQVLMVTLHTVFGINSD